MKILKTITIVISFAIIFGLLAAATYVFFIAALRSDDQAQQIVVQGAFLGAFFAFIFIRIADALSKIYERKAQGRTALVRYEHIFNDYLTQLDDNIYIIDFLASLVKKTENSKGPPPIWTNKLHTIPIDKELVISLTNIELINEIFTINVELRKINDSINSINRTYDMIISAFVQNNIDVKTYLINLKGVLSSCLEIKAFLKEAMEDITRLLAIVGILTKYDTVLGGIISLIIKTKYPKNVLANIDIEITKIKSDIEKNKTSSRDKINKITGNE